MKPVSSTFLRFVLVGISNTLIGMSIIYFAWRFLHLGDLFSNMLGYAVGFVWSYAMNRWWTFQHSGPVSQSLARFVLVCACAYCANLLVLFALRHEMGQASFLPHVAGMVVYTIMGYLGSRFFAFKKSPARLTFETR